jgi:hypothetical protein
MVFKVTIVAALLLFGCTGGATLKIEGDMEERCLDGVIYYFSTKTAMYSGYGYMSVKFNRDGTVARCTIPKKPEEELCE